MFTLIIPKVARENRFDSSITFDFAWSTRYNREILTGEVESSLKAGMTTLMEELGCSGPSINAIAAIPAAVLLRTAMPAAYSPLQFLAKLKSESNKFLLDAHPELRSRVQSLWASGGWVRSVGQPHHYDAPVWILRRMGASESMVAEYRAAAEAADAAARGAKTTTRNSRTAKPRKAHS